jgi:hypothetical protein
VKKAEREHVNRVASLGCVACYVQSGEWFTPGEIHHIREGQGAAQRAGWFEVICLCPSHHRNSEKPANKIAVHAAYKTFTATYGSERELLTLTLNNI